MESLKNLLGIFCLICWSLIFTIVLAGVPPKIRSDYLAIIRTNVTSRIQISCPVIHQQSGNSAGLFFTWLKDNESLPITTEMRFETKGSHLIIKDVEIDDAGIYICMATNGFGSQTAHIQLIVTHPTTESTTSTFKEIENNSDELLIESLSFTEETLRQANHVRITTGSSFDIQCVVTGYPFPHHVWLKNGELYNQSEPTYETGWRKASSHLTLNIRKAASGSSANYTCLALLPKAEIRTTFFVTVLDSAVSGMSQMQPANVTEFRGGRAKFHCWVRSTRPPEIEWLKRLPAGPFRTVSSLYPDTSLVVGEDHYQKVEGEEVMRKEDGSYLKSLQLDPLSETHAGLYICLATNRYGYTIEKTYLNVKPNYETSKESKSVPISIMVALPSILLLSIAGGFVCWMRRREKHQRRLAELAALATGCSPAIRGHQQQQQPSMEETNETAFARGGTGHSHFHSRQTLTSGLGCHRLNEEADTVAGSPATKRTAVQHDLQTNYYFQRHHQLEDQRNTSSSLII